MTRDNFFGNISFQIVKMLFKSLVNSMFLQGSDDDYKGHITEEPNMYKIDFISCSYDLWSCFSYHIIKCVYNTMTIQNIKISISENATYSNFEPAL